ncbi:MAG: hypothetical protein ACOH1J_04030, partial [Microbacteriaceae bacterium]
MTAPTLAIERSPIPSGTSVSRPRRGGRIVGLDAARGLAVLGMIGAHLVLVNSFEWAYPDTWFDLVNGRSAILFGLMAGVSLSLVSYLGRMEGGVELLRARISIVVRALAIFVIGALLEVLDTGFPIILGTYAVVFIAGAWLISWRSRTLLMAAGIVALIAPIVVFAAREVFYYWEPEPLLVETDLVYVLLLSEFAAVLWVAFLMVGIVVGRLDLGSLRIHLRLFLVGAGLMIVGYGLGEVGNSFAPQNWPEGSFEARATNLLLQYPHSATTSEAIGSTGFALLVLALCLAAGSTRVGRVILYPISAVGAMALTVYAGHFVAIILVGDVAEYSTEYTVFLVFLAVTIAVCVGWRALAGSGPLERMVTGLARRAARIPAIQGASAESSATATA